MYCDITPLRGVTSQYSLTRLRLDTRGGSRWSVTAPK